MASHARSISYGGLSTSSTDTTFSDDLFVNKQQQSTVVCSYHAHIAGCWRVVTVLWCRNIMTHTLNLFINNLEGETCNSLKIDLKPWLFWNKKGCKSLHVEGSQIDVYWDFRSAKFTGSPEPLSDYYVAVVSEEEVVLLLGDSSKKAYKKTKARPALVDAAMFCKKENVFAKKCFSTRAKFDDRKKEHDIVVDSLITGPNDPEMWISIDGIVMIHVKNLQWKFRGNQTVMLNTQPVQVYWDVHDWLFTSPGEGHGLFLFKPGQSEAEDDRDGGSVSGSENSEGSKYYSTKSAADDFCLFLFAWKLE